jgi:histidinol-phosphate aminotransferase
MNALIDLDHHGDVDAIPGLVDLAVNVRAGTPPRWLVDRIQAADLAHYPDSSDAVRAVAARHGRADTEVLLTAGAAEAFVLLARSLNPQHAVVVHPQFTEPEVAMRAAGHDVDRVVLEEPFILDPGRIPATADLVVIGNPTNPTSILHPPGLIEALIRPGRLVVVDEAFADCIPQEPASLAAKPDLDGLVIIRSLTKTWGLAGLRIGYLLAAASVVDLVRRAQPAWPVSSPALAAAIACSEPQAIAEATSWARDLVQQREQLVHYLERIDGVRVAGPPAASFVLIRTPRVDVRTALHARGFAVRRAETFPGLDEHWIRVAVRDESTSIAFAHALQEVLA